MSVDCENVILLTADALRADHLSCYGYHRETPPVLDELAEESIRFTNAYGASSHTREAIPALLTGKYPNVAIDSKYRLATDTIASTLSEERFATAGFHSNPLLSELFGFGAGFDTFDAQLPLSGVDLISGRGKILTDKILRLIRKHPYLPAEKLTAKGVSWLNRRRTESPFFMWLHFMDPHSWYDPDTQYLTELYGDISRRKRFKANRALMSASPFSGDPDISAVEKHLPTLKKLYYATVREMDSAIGELLDLLSQIGKEETTALCFTSDHGEAFLEHGTVQHDGGVYSELTHVPLIIRAPELSAETIEWPCQLADIPPTLAALGDISTPDYYIGRNLVQTIDQNQQLENPIISINLNGEPHIAARDSQFTMVNSKKEMRFFDRRETPFEQESCQPEGDIQEKLQRGIQEYNNKVLASNLQSEKVETSEEIQERLEDLGYM